MFLSGRNVIGNADIRASRGYQASPRSLPVRRPPDPPGETVPLYTPAAGRSIPDRGAGAPNRKFINEQVTICFPVSRGPSRARAVCCLRNLFPVRHVSQQQHHLARLLHSGVNCRWRLSSTMARGLNDAVCVCTGEVRAPSDPGQAGPDLVIDVAELIWEPIAD